MKATVKGYVHVLVEKITAKESQQDIVCEVSLGQVAKVSTTAKKSGSSWNEVFLIEVPEDPSRLAFIVSEGERRVGECRYDVNPFFQHPGSTHAISSELYNEQNTSEGSIQIKITYYSAEHGKLKIRVFHLELVDAITDKYPEAKVKVRMGIFAQSTPVRSLKAPFDEEVQIVVLLPTFNLSFDVVHDAGILATYTINNVQESGFLVKDKKAYQVSLFNNGKGVGMIKYQLEWVPRT